MLCSNRSSYLLRVESRSDTMVLESATMWVCVSHSYKYNCGAALSVAHTHNRVRQQLQVGQLTAGEAGSIQ